MTHISNERRAKFPVIPVADTAPEVAYLLSQVAAAHFAAQVGGEKECNSIATVNQGILGAFDVAKAEFMARIVAPYEQSRAKAHGDVFGTWENPASAIHPKEETDDVLASLGLSYNDTI